MASSRLDDPSYAESVALLLSKGLTYAEVAAGLGDGTHRDTVKTWAKDARVQAHLSRMREERINRVTRRIDSAIETRLGSSEDLAGMDIKDLLAIRKELLGPQPQRIIASRGVDEADALGELYAALAANPEAAAALGMGEQAREAIARESVDALDLDAELEPDDDPAD